ncbi:amidohydrolase [Lachnospiraceae bacterium KGMB03038]|nr:amidohydrolase [Lachnospiraceae bacterium KGMB03038]
MRIIDMHAHVDVCEPLHWHDTAEKLLKLMDEAKIEKAVVSAYLNLPGPDMTCGQRLWDSIRPYEDRFMMFLRMDPWFGQEAVDFLEEACQKYPVKGVKLHPAHYTLHPYGDLTVDLCRKAGELGLPVLFHCGDEMMCLPLQIGELAAQCPDTTVILAHMGGYAHNRDAIEVAKKYSNIYIDTSEVPLVKEIKWFVEELGADRIFFGTDAPCCDPSVELKKVQLAGLEERDLEKVLWKNAVRVMKLDEEEK